MSKSPLLVTLGMLILDEFVFDDAARAIMKPPLENNQLVLGGGGTYTATGALIWTSAHEVGMIVDRGHDFPAAVQAALDSYGPMWLFRDDASRETTRARNIYEGETRGFEYLSRNRPQLNPSSLVGTRLYGAKWLHIICAPTRLIEMLTQLDSMPDWTPRICFEPVPFACKPEELDALLRVLGRVDVFSPNHEEAAAFFAKGLPDAMEIEGLARRYVDEGAKDVVIVRSGARGACCTRRNWADCRWVPAYHSAGVVDVTGAGNSFLGGVVVGLDRTDDVIAAARYGAVSASFTIEQWGMPTFKDGLCNGEDPYERLQKLEQMGRTT